MKPNEIVAPAPSLPPPGTGGECTPLTPQESRATTQLADRLQGGAAPARLGCLPNPFRPRAPRPRPPSSKQPFIAVSPTLVRGRRPYIHELDRLKSEFGVKTIINMEDEISVQMWPWDAKRPSPAALKVAAEARGMTLHHIPVSCVTKPPQEQIHRILDIMDDPAAQPVYVHCFKGFERTNFVVAMHRIFRQQADVKEAYKDMLSMGFRRVLVWNLWSMFFAWTKRAPLAGAAVGAAAAMSDKAADAVSEKVAAACLAGAKLCQPLARALPGSPDERGSNPDKTSENLAA